jgi:hypothetical protein
MGNPAKSNSEKEGAREQLATAGSIRPRSHREGGGGQEACLFCRI